MAKRPPLKDKNMKSGLIGLGPIPDQSPVAAFNIGGIENLLETKAFTALLYKHAKLPDRATLAGPVNPNTQGAQRGNFYYEVRQIGIIPQQFKLEDRLSVQGLWGIGSALFNVTGHYQDGLKEVAQIRNFDLIVFPSLTVLTDQLVEFNPTGPMRLQYLVKGVDYLADADRMYDEDVDFEVRDGRIFWLSEGRRPNSGTVLTVVYNHSPIYIVQNMPHALRVIPSNDVGSGALPRDAVYAPQLLVVKPSTIKEEDSLTDWTDLPNYPAYPSSPNTTGGSE